MSATGLKRVTRRDPCPVCGRQKWCSITEDEGMVICMHVSAGSVKPSKNGGFVHVLRERDDWSVVSPVRTAPTPPPFASIEWRHAVYTALLEALPLSEHHADHLVSKRKLSDLTVARNQYATRPDSLLKMFEVARDLAALHDLNHVPGFFQDSFDCWHFMIGEPGFFIPVRDPHGRIQALQIRQDKGPPRYLWFSSSHQPCGASSGAPVHFARPWRAASAGEAIITEGALKADIAAERLDACVVAIAGVSAFRDDFGQWLKRELPSLRSVFVAFDMDWHAKPEVRRSLLRLLASLEAASLPGGLLDWHSSKGLDDLLTREGG